MEFSVNYPSILFMSLEWCCSLRIKVNCWAISRYPNLWFIRCSFLPTHPSPDRMFFLVCQWRLPACVQHAASAAVSQRAESGGGGEDLHTRHWTGHRRRALARLESGGGRLAGGVLRKLGRGHEEWKEKLIPMHQTLRMRLGLVAGQFDQKSPGILSLV